MTTKENIQTNINSRITTAATKVEGGTMQDIIGSVSYELANIIDTKINTLLDNAFVTTADEEHLIIKGEELGIIKKEATYAHVTATITGAQANVTIGEDILATGDSDLIFQVEEEATTDENGSAEVKMVCTTPGIIGNIEAGELNRFYVVYENLRNATIINLEEGSDGYNEESVEDYRARILEYMKDDACNSNIADYTLWAKSVPGVKNVVVQDATIAGAGNVKVYISALNNAPISNELINSVKEKIKKEQIINANLNVYALQYLTISVSAKITLKNGVSLDKAREDFKELLEKYLNKGPSLISYLYVSSLLFETNDIEEVSLYTINEGSESIIVGELQVPVAGEINLTLSGE